MVWLLLFLCALLIIAPILLVAAVGMAALFLFLIVVKAVFGIRVEKAPDPWDNW